MGTREYANGIRKMSAEERRAASKKGFANGIGAMLDHTLDWNDKLTSVKSFIARTGRIPNRYADDDVERHLGNWIMNNKKKEGGTGSERDQLLRRDVPLAFENSVHGDNIWNKTRECQVIHCQNRENTK